MKHFYLQKKYRQISTLDDLIKIKDHRLKFEYLVSYYSFTKALQENELEIWGIPYILDGLNYHYKRFKNLEKRQSPGNTTNTQFYNTINEVTAYLNRLGQLYACVSSKWFQSYLPKDQLPFFCPSILALIPYRHKYAAHRSVDRLMGETPSQHESLSSIYLYNGWHGKANHSEMHIGYQIKIAAQDRCKILRDYYPMPVKDIEHFSDKDEIFIDFVPVKDHERIIEEAFKTVMQLFVYR